MPSTDSNRIAPPARPADQPLVLVIDDHPLIARAVASNLKPLGARVLHAHSGEEGLKVAIAERPDAILLDVNMPGIGGFETCRRLKADPLTCDIPVVFATASTDTEDIARGLGLGAADYVCKSAEPLELRARVASALKVSLLMRQLQKQASTDKLTGLPNRAGFEAAAEACLARASQDPQHRFACLFLDLDHFKLINDSLGHDAGDELLVQVARRIVQCVHGGGGEEWEWGVRRSGDHGHATVARMGGDEFVILLEGLSHDDAAARLAERIAAEVAGVIDLELEQVRAGISIGIRRGRPGDTAEALLRDADAAMYAAKADTHQRWAYFAPAMRESAHNLMRLEKDLHEAIENDTLRLVYQPTIRLSDAAVVGFEALVRWDHPDHGPLPPERITALAARSRLILDLGHWVLERACRDFGSWTHTRTASPPLSLTVNVAGPQLLQRGFVDEVLATLAATGLRPAELQLDIPEPVLMGQSPEAVKVLHRLHRAGVRLSMDDFGTGAFSIGSLHRFPLSTLKIDRTLISNADARRQYAAVIHAIITLARDLGITVSAEGVETQEQVAQLLALNCGEAQGYAFSHPLCPHDAADVARRGLGRERERDRAAA